jgi:hypothetical protein
MFYQKSNKFLFFLQLIAKKCCSFFFLVDFLNFSKLISDRFKDALDEDLRGNLI